MTSQTPHFIVLDSWRGICACFIALFHFAGNNHLYNLALISNAALFVDFFFVLSGFVIFANYEGRLKEGYSLKKFMFLRWARLYPLHIATMLPFIAVEALKLILPAFNALTEHDGFSAEGSTPDYVLHNILLLQSFGLEEKLSFNWPSWSISAEFYTYLLFALALSTLKSRAVFFVVAAAFFSALFLFFTNDNSLLATVNMGVIRCIYGFSIGAIGWMIWKQLNNRISLIQFSNYLGTLIEALILIIVFIFVFYAVQFKLTLLAPYIFVMAVLIFSFEKGFISSLLKHELFQNLGKWSYSIYMVHAFIAGTVFYGVSKVIEKKTDITLFVVMEGKEKIGLTPWIGDLLTLFYFVIVIGVSFITYTIIEEPFRKMSRNYISRNQNK